LFEEKEQRGSPSCDARPRGTAGLLVVIKCFAIYGASAGEEEREREREREREKDTGKIERAGTDGRECAARLESRGDPE